MYFEKNVLSLLLTLLAKDFSWDILLNDLNWIILTIIRFIFNLQRESFTNWNPSWTLFKSCRSEIFPSPTNASLTLWISFYCSEQKTKLYNLSDISPSLRCPLLEPVSSAFFLCSESGCFSLLGNWKVCQTLQRQQQSESSLSFVGLVHHFTSQVRYLKIKEMRKKWFDCVVTMLG